MYFTISKLLQDGWSDWLKFCMELLAMPMSVNIYIALRNSPPSRPTGSHSSNAILMEEVFVYLHTHIYMKYDRLFFVILL